MSPSWQKKKDGNKVYSLETKAMTAQEKQEPDQHVQAIAKLHPLEPMRCAALFWNAEGSTHLTKSDVI